MKKQEATMFFILIVMCICTVGFFKMTQIPQTIPIPPTPDLTTVPNRGITKEKEMLIYDYLEEHVSSYPLKGITILGDQKSTIETDGCNKYYTEINVVGINQLHEVGVYTYCIIIQENVKGDFYIMPYGFEVVEADMDPLKKDILTSTMKVVNEWGLDTTEKKRQNIYKSAPEQWDFETFFEMQKMSKLIVDFINTYSVALSHKDFEQVAHYFKPDTPYYRKQEKEFNNLVQSSYYCDLREIQILDVTMNKVDNSFLVTMQGDIYVYVAQGILKKEFHKTYKVIIEDDHATLLGDRDILE